MSDYLQNKNVLVTGATGLVGSHVLLRLKNLPLRISATSHVRPPLIKAPNIAWMPADLLKPEDCKKIMEGVDCVVMSAARIDRRGVHGGYLADNLRMHLNVLAAAYNAGIKKIVWLGSATAYPPAAHPVKEDYMFAGDPPDDNFGVGWMTRYQEVLCRMYSAKMPHRMTIIVLRCTAIYGEYCDCDLKTCHVLPALMRKIVERRNPLEIWGDGETRRDFIYAGDVADACLSALRRGAGFVDLNIGMGKSYSVNELVQIILDIEKVDDLRIIHEKNKGVKSYSVQVDCAKAGRYLGWKPVASLAKGLEQTIKWFKNDSRG